MINDSNMYQDIIKQLTDINVITTKRKVNPQLSKILVHYRDIEEQIYFATSFIEVEATTAQRINMIVNNVECQGRCLTCNKITEINRSTRRFHQFCNTGCSSKHERTKELREATNSKIYGLDYKKMVREKAAATMMKRYGVSSAASIPDVQTRIQASKIPGREKSRIKRKSTMMRKFGAESYARSKMPLLTQQRLQDAQWLDQQINLYKRTLKAIATELYITSDTLRATLKKHNIVRKPIEIIGVNPTLMLKNKDWLNEMYTTKNTSKTQIAAMLGVTISYVNAWCKRHNIPTNPNIVKWAKSSDEQKLIDFLNSIYGGTLHRGVKDVIAPYEIDAYIPDKKIGIEYDGIKWHSELNGRDSRHHLLKREAAEAQGIRLINVWSSEWKQKQSIVKARLRHIINAPSAKVHARKCQVRELSNSEQKEFFDSHHLQSGVNASYSLGLYFDQRLVSAMSFGKPRFSDNEWEMLRFACIDHVIGGMSKLFSHFVKHINPSNVVSYADKRWSGDNPYHCLGFTFSHNSAPNYYYFHENYVDKLFHRTNFQKHKLAKKLENFDPNLTEWENMKNHGYNRIWDCGNSVWVWTNASQK